MVGCRIHLIYLDIETGSYPGAHHGLASLIGAVRASGHQARLTHVSRNLSVDEFLAAVVDGSDAYGFSAASNQFKHVRRFAGPLSEVTGQAVIVGGLHATLAPQEVVHVKGVTCACRGEGEIFLPKWLDALAAGRDGRDVLGCCYSDGESLVESLAEPVTDLDHLAPPIYDDFDMRRILHDLGERLSVVVSRGCPFRCTFCCNEALRRNYVRPSEYVRLRSPASAVGLTQSLVSKYSPKSIRFEDDLLLLNARWRGEFLELYRCEVGLPFDCNSRADIVTEDLAAQLARAGCLSVSVGVESGDKGMRNGIMKKNVSNEQIVRAFEILHRAGLKTCAYNILGLPMETEEMAWRTYELNRRIRPSTGYVFYFYPYPGTELKELAEEKGMLLEDYEQVSGFMERPCIRETYISHEAVRRVFRRLKAFLFLQRFRTFFPLPRAIKVPLAHVAWGLFLLFPALIDVVLSESYLKRWLRRMVFKVPGASERG